MSITDFLEYIKLNKCEAYDISENITEKNYLYFLSEIKKKTNCIMYFSRNDKTEFIFKILSDKYDVKKKTNHCILSSTTSLPLYLDGKLNTATKIAINRMLKNINECNICLDKNKYYFLCHKCAYSICNTCNDTLMKSQYYKCPHCQESFII